MRPDVKLINEIAEKSTATKTPVLRFLLVFQEFLTVQCQVCGGGGSQHE